MLEILWTATSACGILQSLDVMEIAGKEKREDVDAGTPDFGSVSDDQQRFAGLFEDCRPHLLKVCRRILGQPEGASDAVSETYLRAYRKRADFDGRNFPGWLSRIARHICVDWMERVNRACLPGTC